MFPSVTFATACWERDWRLILLDPDYLSLRQISHHQFPFSEKLLVINNVSDLEAVKRAAQKKIDEGVLTRYVIAKDILPIYGLERSIFSDWQFYNALAPLTAIHECNTDYLLYQTGDVYLKKPVDWIAKAIRCMKKKPRVKVANLTWNENYSEAKKESCKTSWNFYFANQGFSDQMFLVKTSDFKAPIYGEIREDSHHYPWGDILEKRIYSAMKNRGWMRITFRHGSYIHENV